MQMKSILKEWRWRLNEVVVDHPIEETYEKITDWAARVNIPAERLNIKTPPGVKPEEVVTAMFTDLQPKVLRVDKEGAVTKITFDDVSIDVLAPYFDADWQSGEEVSTAEGSLISLSSFNPVDGKTVIRISGNLKDRKGNALLATVDPTTGTDTLKVPLHEQEGESVTVEFDTYDIDVSGDEVTWYFKVNGHEIEVPTIRVFDAEDIAWQLITQLEDDERFPGVDSDDEAQEAAFERQVDTPEFQAAAKEASAEANEQSASHFAYEGRKKDSPFLNIIREQVKKALREQADKEPTSEELIVAEVERDKKFKFPEPLRTKIKGVLAQSKPSYLKAKQWVSAKADQELKKKSGKGKGSGKAPQKDEEWGAGDPCIQACKGETNLDTCIKGCRKANR